MTPEILLNYGVGRNVPLVKMRYIQISNIVGLFLIIGGSILGFTVYIHTASTALTIVTLLFTLIGLGAPLLNKAHEYALSRLILAIGIPVIIMLLSITIKVEGLLVPDAATFYISRTLLVTTLIMPMILFSVSELDKIIGSLLVPAILIILYDRIHSIFNVGFAELFDSTTNTPMTAEPILVFMSSAAIILYFKRSTKKVISKQEGTINKLSTLNDQINFLLEDKTRLLHESNLELRQYNNDLMQYSNTISHNLRGPVANLLGLTNLFRKDIDSHTLNELISHIRRSAEALDDVLVDLGKIVDIRNNLYHIKENVNIEDEYDKVTLLLSELLDRNNTTLITNFEYSNLFCVRSYLKSIFYNLISNAIKYGQNGEINKIYINSYLADDHLVIEVQDNGIGIDLKQYGANIFGMYKRFHEDTSGKGLGLFLTKQQVEAMGGKIDVDSELGVGTRFTAKIPNHQVDEIKEQLYYESEAAAVWFDSVNYIATLIWKRNPAKEEFREALYRTKELAKSYHCKACIKDERRIDLINKDNSDWFVNNFILEAPKIGVQSFVLVHSKNDNRHLDYYEYLKGTAEKSGVKLHYNIHDLEHAKDYARQLSLTIA